MSTSGRVSLIVTSADQAAELFVINSNLERVARGIGTVSTRQPVGVYKIKVRAGQVTHEELVALEEAPVKRRIDHLHIPSATPLDATGQSHEYHQDAVREYSVKPWVKVGAGASIFVFARDWNPLGRRPRARHHPAEGLTLRQINGKIAVDVQSKSRRDLSRDPWAACNVEVSPGPYLLAVRTATSDVFEMSLFALPNWRLQVFLLQRDNESSVRGRCPDLASASIRMTRSSQFSFQQEDDRLSELARLALVDRRQVLSDQLKQILQRKYENPMFGIIGGHLILRSPKPDLGLLRVVVNNLRRSVLRGMTHPDVEALALAAGLAPQGDFSIPPMLRASWDIMLKHSSADSRLIPPGSLAARVAARVTNQQPWLIWAEPSTSEDWVERMLPDFTEYLERERKDLAYSVRRAARSVARRARGEKALKPEAQRLAEALELPRATVDQLLARAESSQVQEPKMPASIKLGDIKKSANQRRARKALPRTG